MSRALLQQALDAVSDLKGYRDDIDEAIAALREALEAPEPVARCILDNGDEMGSVEWLVRPRSIRLDHGSLLYAAPPAAPAPAAPVVPLTDGQIRQIVRDTFDVVPLPHDITFARAIEAAHGITGGGNG